MSSDFKDIEGSNIRRMLRERGLQGGGERTCCGGNVIYSRDYETQLKRLGMKGRFNVLERGVLVSKVVIA
jgi:hypothetical protein